MTAGLKSQLRLGRDYFDRAAAQKNMELAKFALGMVSGAVVAAAPSDERHGLSSRALAGAQEQSIAKVIELGNWFIARGRDY